MAKLKLGDGDWAVKDGELLCVKETDNGAIVPLPFEVDRNSEASYINKDGVLAIAPPNIARIDFSDNVEGHLLLEPQNENLLHYSEDFTQSSWFKSRSSINPNQIIAPDGSLSSDKLIEDTSNNNHSISVRTVNGSTVNTETYTFSFFAQSGERDFIQIRCFEGTSYSRNSRVNVSLIDGSVSSTTDNNGSASSIETSKIGDFIKVQFSVTLGGAENRQEWSIFTALSIDDDSFYQGDGVSGVYIWGAQLEQTSKATSYIPTNGSTVTRLGDKVFGAGDVNAFNSEEGVFFIEIAAPLNSNAFIPISINDGSSNNRIMFYYASSNNQITVDFRITSNLFLLRHTLQDITDFNKIAFKYKSGDFSLWVNGVEVATDNSVASFPPNTINTLSFDNSSGSDFYGKVKNVIVYDSIQSAIDDGLDYITQ